MTIIAATDGVSNAEQMKEFTSMPKRAHGFSGFVPVEETIRCSMKPGQQLLARTGVYAAEAKPDEVTYLSADKPKSTYQASQVTVERKFNFDSRI